MTGNLEWCLEWSLLSKKQNSFALNIVSWNWWTFSQDGSGNWSPFALPISRYFNSSWNNVSLHIFIIAKTIERGSNLKYHIFWDKPIILINFLYIHEDSWILFALPIIQYFINPTWGVQKVVTAKNILSFV